MPNHFHNGDLALVIDARERRYLIKLAAGKSFHSHLGHVPHDLIIGQEEGSRLRTHSGREVLVLRPSLADFILKMPRQSQVIYPKDIGPILMYADIYPGATVLEAGIGSGAMTLALLRAVGSAGRVVTCEIREDLAAQALGNMERFLRAIPENFTLRHGDIYQGAEEREMDRMVLDLPEPWQAVAVAADALRSGGILACYVPTVLQVHRLYEALDREPRFAFFEAFEVLHRPWHLAPTSARPVHRMVAHTGFIVRAVRCQPGRAPAPPPGEDEPSGEGQA